MLLVAGGGQVNADGTMAPAAACGWSVGAVALPHLSVPAGSTPPAIRNPRSLAYDGRGNAVVKSEEDIAAAVASLGGYEKGLYAEK